MKGTLHKRNDKWVVIYGSAAGREIWPITLPLHPDDVNGIIAADIFNPPIDGQPIDFEIVLFEREDGLISHVAKMSLYISDNFQIGPDGAYEHDFQTKPGFVERRMEQMLDITAREEFKNVGDEGLFPNHTDKDIWMSGFKAGYMYRNNQK